MTRPASRLEVVEAHETAERAVRAAGALSRRGLREGDRIVLLTRGCGDYLAVVIGALRAGVIPVPVDPSLTEHERRPLIDDADPALVVDSPQVLAALVADESDSRAPRSTQQIADLPRARPMHYTSGTTGRAKGVFSGLLEPADAEALFTDEADFWQIDADDVHVVASPLHHSAPLRFSISTLLRGGRVILTGPFDAATWAAAVEDHRPTTAFVVPAHLRRLLDVGMPTTTSFRLLAHAGAACPQTLKHATMQAFPPGVVWEFYGSTEGQFTACPGEEWLERPGTVGRARPGRRLRADDDGRLWCAVPPFARFSYWRDPERTARAWHGDEFTVGDLGRIDDDGYVYLDGRRDDLVISGGVNVYPAEVESALCEMPGVVEAGVFGVPDERWGQRVCAAVVGDVDEVALAAWARERLAPAKRPKQYVRVDDLPRTTTGKIRRLDLARFVGRGEEGSP